MGVCEPGPGARCGAGSQGPQSVTRRTPHPDSWRCGRQGGTGQPAGARHRQTWAGRPSRGALRYPLAQMRNWGSERARVACLTFRGKECRTVMEPRPRAPSPGAQLSQRPLPSSWRAFHVAPPVAGKLAPFPKRSKRRTFPWKQFPARASEETHLCCCRHRGGKWSGDHPRLSCGTRSWSLRLSGSESTRKQAAAPCPPPHKDGTRNPLFSLRGVGVEGFKMLPGTKNAP